MNRDYTYMPDSVARAALDKVEKLPAVEGLTRLEADYERFFSVSADQGTFRGWVARQLALTPLAILRHEVILLAGALNHAIEGNRILVDNAQAMASEALPNLRFENGRPTADAEASVAIKAISEQGPKREDGTPGENRFRLLELAYQQHSAVGNKDEAMDNCRALILELARGYQKLLSEKAAMQVQASFGEEYQRMVERDRLMWHWLRDNFEADMRRAENQNVPLPEVMKEIMLRGNHA